MTENIFAQFDDTNNQFNNVNFHFGGDEQSPANFAMNEKTTGKLQFKDLSIISLCVDEQSGPKLFSDNGLMNSKETLEYFQILSHCPDSYYSFASNFLTGADKLNFVMLSGYNYDAQPFPESMEGIKFMLLETLKLSNLSPATLPNMPVLQVLEIDTKYVDMLPAGILDNYPMLEEFWLSNGDLETVEPGFFQSMSHSKVIHMVNNKINSIDLSGLSPDTEVNLERNAITQLTEQNFRPFVESILNTGATGKIKLMNNALECSCDVKWLISDLEGAHVFESAVCADGTRLTLSVFFS